MNKHEFLASLQSRLQGFLPQADVQNTLDYYSEAIDDRMDDGMSEEEAVASLGSAQQVADQILADIPMTRLVKNRFLPQHSRPLAMVLLVLGLPLWGSLVLAAGACLLAAFCVMLALLVAYYAMTLGLLAGTAAALAGGVICAVGGKPTLAVALAGGGLMCCALAMLMLLGVKPVTKLAWKTMEKLPVALRSIFVKKEEAA